MIISKIKKTINKLQYNVLPKYFFSNKVYVLLYHSVSPIQHYLLDNMKDTIHLSVDKFEEQIKFLNNNYKVVSIKDFIENKVKEESVIITFDDGYQDNYQYAYPILKHYKLPFSICINSNFINNGDMFWLSKINLLQKKNIYDNFLNTYGYSEITKKVNNLMLEKNIDDFLKNNKISASKISNQEQLYLNESDINKMDGQLISILPHTHRHYKTTDLEYNERKKELENSINFCKNNFINYYQPVFSFPFGIPSETFGDIDLDILKNNEIYYYFSACGGINNIDNLNKNINRKSISSKQNINDFKYFIEKPTTIYNSVKRFFE